MVLSEKGTTPAPAEGSVDKSQAKSVKSVKREFNPNFDGYTQHWTDLLDEKPMLISDYPENQSFYDFYFNLESNGWAKFSLDMEMNNA
jgi:dynein heavy chain